MRFLLILLIFLSPLAAFPSSMDEYLVELGEFFLQKDRLDEAQIEFTKALIVNPSNEKARKYLNYIRELKVQDSLDYFSPQAKTKEEFEVFKKKLKKKDKAKIKIAKPRKKPREIIKPKAKIKSLRVPKKPEVKKLKPKKPSLDKVKEALNEIIKSKAETKPPKVSKVPKKPKMKEVEKKKLSTDKVKEALRKISESKKKPEPKKIKKRLELFKVKPKKEEKGKISGEAIVGMGFTSEDFIWKKANWDLNELDWRIRSKTAHDAKENTYDPGIYNRLKFIIDTDSKEPLSFHANITIDPWSFVGKSQRVTIEGVGTTDTAELQLKYWSNTGYTIDETIYTLNEGAAINLPEMKVRGGGRIDSAILESTNTSAWPGVYFNLPELKIHREFWPLRELWFDYNKEDMNIRFFPIGLQDQALTSDDPLGLSNHHIYWEESPWLDKWEPGNYNSTEDDFTQGKFDDELSWFTRNSEGERLTSLRGLSLDWFPYENSGIEATFASSKTLWQDYDSFDTLSGAFRGKLQLSDQAVLGFVNTLKLGFKEGTQDADNFVWGADFSYVPSVGTKVQMEIASSKTHTDKTTAYKLRKKGSAYQIALMSNNLEEDVLNKSYDEISLKKGSELFLKGKFTLTHMDEGFDPGLATYLETRRDQFWSRHLHFRKPLDFFYGALYEPSLKWDDIKGSRIGDSIDIGRDVVALRLQGQNFLDGKLDGLIDVRNAHDVDGKYIETIARIENTYRVNAKLTAKLLGIYHDLPDTILEIDPFYYDPNTGSYADNADIEDGKDPSIKTLSLGFEYEFTDWFDAYTIWEHTNDYTVGYNHFPRSILNSKIFTTNVSYGKTYRLEEISLNDQFLFPLPPYRYYDIYKIGVNFYPNDKLKIYLDWTINEYKHAGQIDDNMNHVGLEVQYVPLEKIILYFKYVYSNWKDLNRMADGEGVFNESHHNFFLEADWVISETDSLALQYGAMGKGVSSEFLYDPYGGAMSTLDTQHIFRIYYRKKF